ncbi:hypothetical protein BKA81DRAFT_78360 [Phyllosticta paracitricarpa]
MPYLGYHDQIPLPASFHNTSRHPFPYPTPNARAKQASFPERRYGFTHHSWHLSRSFGPRSFVRSPSPNHGQQTRSADWPAPAVAVAPCLCTVEIRDGWLGWLAWRGVAFPTANRADTSVALRTVEVWRTHRRTATQHRLTSQPADRPVGKANLRERLNGWLPRDSGGHPAMDG